MSQLHLKFRAVGTPIRSVENSKKTLPNSIGNCVSVITSKDALPKQKGPDHCIARCATRRPSADTLTGLGLGLTELQTTGLVQRPLEALHIEHANEEKGEATAKLHTHLLP